MKNKKKLYILMGLGAILLGIICIFSSEMPVILSGIGLLLYGIVSFYRWRERKKAGAAGIWALAGMLLAIVFGVSILIGSRFENFAIHILLIVLSVWLLAEGVLELLGDIMYRKAMTSADLGVHAPGSTASMVLGIIMTAVGILGILFPVFAGFMVKIWIVAELIVSGIRLILLAGSAGALEGNNG